MPPPAHSPAPRPDRPPAGTRCGQRCAGSLAYRAREWTGEAVAQSVPAGTLGHAALTALPHTTGGYGATWCSQAGQAHRGVGKARPAARSVMLQPWLPGRHPQLRFSTWPRCTSAASRAAAHDTAAALDTQEAQRHRGHHAPAAAPAAMPAPAPTAMQSRAAPPRAGARTTRRPGRPGRRTCGPAAARRGARTQTPARAAAASRPGARGRTRHSAPTRCLPAPPPGPAAAAAAARRPRPRLAAPRLGSQRRRASAGAESGLDRGPYSAGQAPNAWQRREVGVPAPAF